jgi:hypothetical protein
MMRASLQLWTVLLAIGFLPVVAVFARSEPHIAYSDLVSGPADGGENNLGAIVTVCGSGFGSIQGTSQVLLAGTPVRRILQWTDYRIAFQIGSTAKSGDVRVVSGGVQSNASRFTITAGKIYFVSPSGRDGAPGRWNKPWKTIPHAVAAMKPGDITYVLDGVRQVGIDNYHAALSIQRSGSEHRPMALVAYPGATAVIGDAAGPEFGARTPAIRGGPFNDWVIAGFTMRGANTALRLDSVARWRIVNNDFSCPGGDGSAGCVEVSGSSSIAFFGNTVHDSGKPGGSKKYQSVYFTSDSNHIEVGWNRILDNHSCRGLQFHSSPVSAGSGFNQYDLLIHDNEISGQVCDGINLATIDPSKGRIALFNNLIFHVGTGPAPPDGESSYTCINSPGIVNRGAPGAGSVEIYNNTLSDCGSRGGPSAGAFYVGRNSPDLILVNNLVDQHGEPYFASRSALGKISGSSNLWSGSGPGPAETSGNTVGTPEFSQGRHGYELNPDSPARHSAATCPVAYDLAGARRGRAAKCSIGAYE